MCVCEPNWSIRSYKLKPKDAHHPHLAYPLQPRPAPGRPSADPRRVGLSVYNGNPGSVQKEHQIPNLGVARSNRAGITTPHVLALEDCNLKTRPCARWLRNYTTRKRTSPRPSTYPVISSPRETAPTPAGVPAKMRSPGFNSNRRER